LNNIWKIFQLKIETKAAVQLRCLDLDWCSLQLSDIRKIALLLLINYIKFLFSPTENASEAKRGGRQLSHAISKSWNRLQLLRIDYTPNLTWSFQNDDHDEIAIPHTIKSTSLTRLHITGIGVTIPKFEVPGVTYLDLGWAPSTVPREQDYKSLLVHCDHLTHFTSFGRNTYPIPWSLMGEQIRSIHLDLGGDLESGATRFDAFHDMLMSPRLNDLESLHLTLQVSCDPQLIFGAIMTHWKSLKDLSTFIFKECNYDCEDDDGEFDKVPQLIMTCGEEMEQKEALSEFFDNPISGDSGDDDDTLTHGNDNGIGGQDEYMEMEEKSSLAMEARVIEAADSMSTLSLPSDWRRRRYVRSSMESLSVPNEQWLDQWECPSLHTLVIGSRPADVLPYQIPRMVLSFIYFSPLLRNLHIGLGMDPTQISKHDGRVRKHENDERLTWPCVHLPRLEQLKISTAYLRYLYDRIIPGPYLEKVSITDLDTNMAHVLSKHQPLNMAVTKENNPIDWHIIHTIDLELCGSLLRSYRRIDWQLLFTSLPNVRVLQLPSHSDVDKERIRHHRAFDYIHKIAANMAAPHVTIIPGRLELSDL
jgi:hypothetical protein